MSEPRQSAGSIRFATFEADVRAGELRKHGIRIKLQDQPFRVLQILLERPGEVVTREELQRQIWPSDTFVDFDRGLNNAVKRLREALADSADEPRYIETLPKRGYRFIAPVQVVNGHNGAEPKTPVVPIETVKPKRNRLLFGRWFWTGKMIAAAIMLVVLGIAILFIRGRVAGKVAVAPVHSIAVLPLQNLSGDPSQDYFADAMTEELITELSRISALNVISRTTVMRYKRTDKSLPDIARELHVEGVVEGSVLRAGDRVRVTAQLIYAPKDANLWAQTYDRDARDVLTLQTAIASAIAEEIKVKMTANEQARLQSPPPVNYAAVVAYLEGRKHLARTITLQFQKNLQGPTRAEFTAAVSSFEKAIQEDPKYLQGHLAFFEAMDGQGENHLELMAKAREGIRTALDLDETSVTAHVYKGMFLSQYEWNWPAAENEYRRALELGPNSAKAHEAYSRYLVSLGRAAEGQKEDELAQRLDPSCDEYLGSDGPLGCLDFETELKVLEETKSTDGLCFVTAAVAKDLWLEGKYPESIAELEKMQHACGYPELADALASGYAQGDPQSALSAYLKGMEIEIADHQPIPPAWMAFLYSAVNDRENAFRWLAKAYDNHSWCIMYLKDDAIWNPIRNDPRFATLIRRAGLPE
jgi:TolB-like protein/DNA-binding winged helix-turn-helix (wHTH) protein